MNTKAVLTNRFVILALVAAAIGSIGWLANRDVIARQPLGPASTCQAVPAFVKPFNLSQPYFDTSRRDRPGLVLVDAAKPETIIQKPNWRQFGSLGPLANGEGGVTFTANVPVVNTLDTNEQNHLTVLRLDPDSGDISSWLKLEGPPLSSKNYYGITSMAYDCETKMLYVAAVAGSTSSEEDGFISVIDTTSGAERFRYKGLDALGIGIYGGGKGRHLYAGLARSSDVVRLKLTQEGKPFGKAEQVLEFDELNQTRARKLDFQANKLTIDTTEFYYNLVASTEFEQRRLTYEYNQAEDRFE